MGADLCLWAVSWPRKAKLDWAAGFKAVEDLDEDSLEGQGYSRDEMKGFVSQLKDAVEGGGREVARLEFAHLYVLVTGGMSWGDTPTEFGNVMQALEDFSSVLTAIGFDRDNVDYKEKFAKAAAVSGTAPLFLNLDPDTTALMEEVLRKESRKKKRKAG